MIKFSSKGGSHGEFLFGQASGLPKGYNIDLLKICDALNKRKCGIGRSERQNIETDNIEIISGLDKNNATNGEMLEFKIANVDNTVAVKPPITALRPGHADLVGCVKYNLDNARSVAEVVGGRSTLTYTVLGNICKQILEKVNVFTYGLTRQIKDIVCYLPFDYEKDYKSLENSKTRCHDSKTDDRFTKLIVNTREDGDTLGGIVEIGCIGLPIGLGDYHDYFDKLDSKISAYLVAIPSVKGIEFGLGQKFALLTGTQCADKLQVVDNKIQYQTNNCGGIVGGLSNGKPIECFLTVKPVPSTKKGVETFDIKTLRPTISHFERSDVCVAPNIAVIGENMIATVILDEILRDKMFAQKIGLINLK